jgi:diacylglycerol kinase
MNNKQPFFKAFINAFSGIKYFFLHERNGKIQCAAAFAAIALSFFFHINISEWVAVLLCIGMVLSLEMLNSAIEKICDIVHSEYDPLIKIVKDVSAAAVLWSAIVSVVIGAIIFIPKIITLL